VTALTAAAFGAQRKKNEATAAITIKAVPLPKNEGIKQK
jgi:hypothetical protein